MILGFATKRDRNGNRYLLIIDTDNKKYARESYHWFCREDFAEISKSDRRRIIDKLMVEGFEEVERLAI